MLIDIETDEQGMKGTRDKPMTEMNNAMPVREMLEEKLIQIMLQNAHDRKKKIYILEPDDDC
jgi:hypothetical protein